MNQEFSEPSTVEPILEGDHTSQHVNDLRAEVALRQFLGVPVVEPEPEPEMTWEEKRELERQGQINLFVSGLRELADFYNEHRNLKLPNETTFHIFGIEKADLGQYARAFGTADKVFDEYSFKLVKKFGPFTLATYHSRDAVCQRVKVSEEVVPAHIIPAQPETIVEEKVREVFEWRCPEFSLLKQEEEREAEAAASDPAAADRPPVENPDDIPF